MSQSIYVRFTVLALSFRGNSSQPLATVVDESRELKANCGEIACILGQMYTVAYGIGNRPDTNLGPVPAQAGRHASYS